MSDLQRLHEAAVLAPQLLTRIRMRLAVGEHLQPDEQLDKMQECIEVLTRAYADGSLIEVKKVQAPVEAAAPWQRKWNSQVADSLLEKFASFSLTAAEERARVAEAMWEWLAGRATMIERELGRQPTWDSSDDWLAAARKAAKEADSE